MELHFSSTNKTLKRNIIRGVEFIFEYLQNLLKINCVFMEERSLEIAVFAAGCFWCTEAVFNRVKGVQSVVSGFTGGVIKNPAYREICTGRTGHAEGIKFQYDPEVISYMELLEIFFATHDPTTLNRQANDVGTQYRSAIFYTSEEQKLVALKLISYLNDKAVFENDIVTEVTPLDVFYEAEVDHHQYYERYTQQPYCQVMIGPKIKKLGILFKDQLK